MTTISLNRLRQYEQPKHRNTAVVFEIVLFVVVMSLLLMTLITGVNTYKAISEQRQADEQSRVSLNLIANSVRIADYADSVSTGTGPEGPALVLSEYLDSGTYETRIYEYRGSIVQEYAAQGTPYTPERAAQLAKNAEFSFTYENGLLIVQTDQGDVRIAPRSARTGATS